MGLLLYNELSSIKSDPNWTLHFFFFIIFLSSSFSLCLSFSVSLYVYPKHKLYLKILQHWPIFTQNNFGLFLKNVHGIWDQTRDKATLSLWTIWCKIIIILLYILQFMFSNDIWLTGKRFTFLLFSLINFFLNAKFIN